MNNNILVDKIREIIKTVLILDQEDMEELNNDEDLENLGLTSVLLLQFIVNLEQEFKIEIDEEDIIEDNFGTVNKIARYINDIINKK